MKKIISGIFMLILVSCFTTRPNTEQGDKTFVKQTSAPGDLRCGAFCMAFYKWLKEGKTYSADQSADYNTVNSIYDEVKFGSAYSSVSITGIGTMNLSAYNNPLKLLVYADTKLENSSAKFYRDTSDAMINDIYNEVLAHDSSIMRTYGEKIKTGGIPSLANDDYAIVVILVTNALDTPINIHLLLFHKTPDGLEYYDPYSGVSKQATEEQLRGAEIIEIDDAEEGLLKLRSLNSCLLLP
jgi:hypothetical protein